jgi:cell wall assembly regulator SMI1
MDKAIWDKWVRDWNWILMIAKKRNWDHDPLLIKPPVKLSQITQLEKELGINYPSAFKTVLTEYASGVRFGWQIEGEETEGEFKGVFCGCGRGYLWDFGTLKDDYENYIKQLEGFPNIDDEYDRVWHNKIPFLDVPNGDTIAFDIAKGLENSAVVYLSHEGDDFHGSRLGENFIEFITRWSNLGCIGTEDWQYEPFYDSEKRKLRDHAPVIERWKQWLEK